MSRKAAGAALTFGAFALIVEPGSAATLEIHSPVDLECCAIFEGSMLQNDPASKAGDPLVPAGFALKESGGAGGNFLDAVSSLAAPEPSVLTRILMIFADLRNTVFRSPAAGP